MKDFNNNERFRREGSMRRDERRPAGERDSLSELLMRCGHFIAHNTDGARGQGRIMRILVEKREMSQKELLSELGIKAGSLSEVLQRLEERGFIVRRQDEEDKRRTLISVTDEGLAEAEKHTNEPASDVFSPLSAEEQETLRGLLKKLDESWLNEMSRRGRPGRGAMEREGRPQERGPRGFGRGERGDRPPRDHGEHPRHGHMGSGDSAPAGENGEAD